MPTKPASARARTRPAAARGPSAHVQQKQDRKRREILDAAAAVFAEHGYFNATMKHIAERLEMQPGSLYHYFPSKEAALEEICRVSAVEFCDRLREIIARGGPAVDMVREGMLSHLTSDRRAYVESFAFSRRNLPPGVLAELNTLARNYRQLWRKVFTLGAERSEWRAGLDADVAADAVLALCNSAATILGHRRSGDAQKSAALWIDLFLHGSVKR